MVGAMDERGRFPGAGALAMGTPSASVGRNEKSVNWLLSRNPPAMRPDPKTVSIDAVRLIASPSLSITER